MYSRKKFKHQGGSIMTEQELKEFCIKALEQVPVPQNMQERVRIAKDFADRLFVADYFSKENRINFVKNELCSHFDLNEEDVKLILNSLEEKEQRVNDKLQIAKFKRALKYVPIYNDEFLFEGMNFQETDEIIKYIEENYSIKDKRLINNFVIQDLCKHFKLSKLEIEEIKKLQKERIK